MTAAVSAGSNPVPGSPSFFSPTRWNSWTVDVICGALSLVALYFIWKFTHSSTQAPPKQGSNSTALFLAKQHPISIPTSDEATPCINEIAPLSSEKFAKGFAEGIIRLDMPKDVYDASKTLRLRIPGEDQPFFERMVKTTDTIFVPNLPYLENILIFINSDVNVLEVKFPRGLYTVPFSGPTSSKILSQEIKKTSELKIIDCPLMLNVDGITVIFEADGTINATSKEEDVFFVMENKGAACAVYLEISVPEEYRLTENQSLVLIWMLEANQQITLYRYQLREKCTEAYNSATKKEVTFHEEDSLQLLAIAHRAYEDIPPLTIADKTAKTD